ncbi:MAG TPA: hypothetical protein VGQ36_12345 [Thermoanaerobaculia bacterium]|jgi:hypothetical protein|nr:hypothetical protein [Thermoanaerobaculia bacterium]
MRRISAIQIVALAVALAGIVLPITGQPAEPSAFLLQHGTIVDSGRGVVYIAKPSGTIDAVDLASGRTLWTSKDAALPIGLGNDLLVAQVEEKPQVTERFQIAILDAAGGRKVSEATITLPAGALALVTDHKGKMFRATAERVGALFLVSWLYQENLVRGIRPPDKEQTMLWIAGSVSVQALTGKVVFADGGPVGEVPGRWQRYGTPPSPPWRAGNVVARTEGGRGGPLTLERTETGSGRLLPAQPLVNRAITSVPSADQRHLLASERVGEGGPDDPEYQWSIFAMDTAAKATELRKDVSAAPFFVFGDSVILESRPHSYLRGELLVEEPLEIHAIRLTTGVAKWEVELRDLSYRGPRPPGR